ncbi:MAG: DUF3307 domain-containing protein [Bacteroidetes bacterium]|nr:DUF3307 domain-containing protein [Bacteroidota bacterium]
MIVLLKLLLSHVICDFMLKTATRSETTPATVLTRHTSGYFLCILLQGLLPTLLIRHINFLYYGIGLMLFALISDLLERRLTGNYPLKLIFWLDQAMHILVIIAVWLIYTGTHLSVWELKIPAVFWVYANAILFLAGVSSVVIQHLMGRWFRDIQQHDMVSLKKAGTYIGILERLFVFTFVVTNHWEAIGFLVAAKSVFRFGDLQESRNRILTEYVLIGTLLSFGLSIACGLLTLQLLPVAP